MPFNKGDFTQLGVAGHVNANLRLNEKRLVNVDMTSNENAAGCTITGNVTDLLNNQVYNIGSAPSGNIEITENGENINVAPYATATVNVSGGGGSMLKTTLTIVNSTGGVVRQLPIEMRLDYVLLNNNVIGVPINSDGAIVMDASNMPEIELQNNQTMTLILYYGVALGSSPSRGIKFASAGTATISNAVNFTFNEDAGAYLVTDGSIDSSITVTLE